MIGAFLFTLMNIDSIPSFELPPLPLYFSKLKPDVENIKFEFDKEIMKPMVVAGLIFAFFGLL